MRAVVQRVSRAWVDVEGERQGSIGRGLVVLVGVGVGDQIEDASYVAEKIINLRIFPDEEGKLNYSVRDIQGELLVVSQFTLFGDCRKGRRPSFTQAAPPEVAFPIYEEFLRLLARSGLRIVTGKFQSMMEVGIVNDGPVTILLDSKKKF
jgi:D-tyrosyl-tRNA(Tyr) deacylase